MLAAVLALALLVPASARAFQNPSLGELALKEQQRRKALKASGAGKVVTNDDLPRGIVTIPPPAAAAAPEPKAEDKTKPEEPAKDEAWWKERMNAEREALRRNEMFAVALQTRINSLTNDFSARDDPYQRAQISQERVKAIQELDRLKTDVEMSKKKMADIEEEARRAGVPPGWLR